MNRRTRTGMRRPAAVTALMGKGGGAYAFGIWTTAPEAISRVNSQVVGRRRIMTLAEVFLTP